MAALTYKAFFYSKQICRKDCKLEVKPVAGRSRTYETIKY